MECSELMPEDLRHVVRHLPADVRRLMEDRRLYCAGGFVRAMVAGDERPTDIDLWGARTEQLQLAATELATARGRGTQLIKTANAWTVATPARLPVQFIFRWLFEGPTELVQSFDFTVARACVALSRDQLGKPHWCSWIDVRFYPDLASRRIRYCAPDRVEDEGGSLLRAVKFARRGYHVGPEAIGLLVARAISKLHSIDAMPEHQRANLVTAALRQVDPLTILPGDEVADEEPIAGLDPEHPMAGALAADPA